MNRSSKQLFDFEGYTKLDYDAEFPHSLQGQVCVMTGGTRGIGLEVLRFLASKHCTLIVGTTKLNANTPIDQVNAFKSKLISQITTTNKDSLESRLFVLPLEMTSMKSVNKFAKQIGSITNKVDILVSLKCQSLTN